MYFFQFICFDFNSPMCFCQDSMGTEKQNTPRTEALCAKLQPLAESLSVDNFGEVAVQCIAESLALCTALERELAEARAARDAARDAIDEDAHNRANV